MAEPGSGPAPDFLVRIFDAGNFVGTGILISPRLVLTCWHCWKPAGRLLRAPHVSQEATRNVDKEIRILSEPFAQDPHPDLVVLELEKEVELSQTPQFLAPTTRKQWTEQIERTRWWALGFVGEDQGRDFRQPEVTPLTSPVPFEDGSPDTQQLRGGLPEGMSGGAVAVRIRQEGEETWLLIGMLYLGGEKASISRFRATRGLQELIRSREPGLATELFVDLGPVTLVSRAAQLTIKRGRKLFDVTTAPNLLPPGLAWDQSTGRRRGMTIAYASLLLVALLFLWRELIPPRPVDQAALGNLLFTTCWITYDPSGKKLDTRRHAIYPERGAIEADLDIIRSAGFNGILTSSSDGVMAEVPKLAKQRDLKVIMGVWNPADREELSYAIRQADYVDAYCVGNSGLITRYSMWQLRRAVFLVKKRTGRPATTSELVTRYREYKRLLEIGDWLCPDAHLTLKDHPTNKVATVDLERDLNLFMNTTAELVESARSTERPLMLKNVAYPYAGVQGGSRDNQAEFFRCALDFLSDPQRGLRVPVAVVPQGAFDAPWKTEEPFLAWDPFTGLIPFNPATNRAKLVPSQLPETQLRSPAAREIIRRFPHLPRIRQPGEAK